MVHDILLVLIGLIVGAIIGFIFTRKYMEKYIKQNNVIFYISILSLTFYYEHLIKPALKNSA